MTATPKKSTTRGRPLDADGALTKAKIIDGARQCFAKLGYADATNKKISSTIGMTAGVIYNHFSSKKDIYFAVLEEGESYIAEAYEKAIANIDSPIESLCKLIDLNAKIHKERPDLAPFLSLVRSEAVRHPELAEYLLHRDDQIQPIFTRLIREGQRKGEISKAIPAKNIETMILSATIGISMFGLQSGQKEHLKNMKAFRKLLDGSLFNHGE